MNKDKRNNIQLLGTLNNADESGIIANANQIYDANEDKSTQDVSKEHKERIETLETKESSMQTTLENITKTGEASAASNVTYNHSDSKLDATNVQQAIDEVRKRSNYNDGENIIDFNTIHIITDNPEFAIAAVDANDRILYGIKADGQPCWGVGVPKVVRDYVDKQVNLISTKTVFDISAYHATGGTLATYDNLEDALGANGKNIPQSLRKGGMSVKFVQSSDNKYVQWILMADNWSIDVNDWQGVDDEPTAGSDNLVKSGGVANKISQLEEETIGLIFDLNTDIKQSDWFDIERIPIHTEVILELIEDKAGEGVTVLGRASTESVYQVLVSDFNFHKGDRISITTAEDINQIKINTKTASSATNFEKRVICRKAASIKVQVNILKDKVNIAEGDITNQKALNKSFNSCVFTNSINANSHIKELYINTDVFPLKAFFIIGATNTWFVIKSVDDSSIVAQFKVNGNEGKMTESVAGSASSGYILFNNFSTITQGEDNITILKDALNINKSPHIYTKINIEPNISSIETVAQNAKTTADGVDARVGDYYSSSIETDKKQGDWTLLDNELPIGTELSLLCTKDEAGDGVTVLASSHDTPDTYFVLASDTEFKVGVSKNIVTSESIKWLKLNTKRASTASVFEKKVDINISRGLIGDVVKLKNSEKWSTIESTLDVSFNTLFKSANKCFATLIDDDTAALAAIENIKSICDNKNIKCTFSCITDNLSIEGIEQKLLDYQDEGFNIVSHSKTHDASVWKFSSYDELPLAAIEKEMSISKRVLLQKGFFDSDYIVYPWGLANNDTWKDIVAKLSRKYFKAGCSTTVSEKYNAKVVNDKCLLYRIQISTVTTMNQIKAYIDECFNQNGWLIIFTHSNMPEFSADMLNQTIDYIKGKGIEFKTLAEGWNLRKQLYQYKDIVE